MRNCLLLFLLVAAPAAWAQVAPENLPPPPPPPPQTAPPLVEAPEEPEPPPASVQSTGTGRALVVKPGERLRVETTQGQTASGELVSLMPGALSLQASPEQVLTILLRDVQELETRKRAPGHGALVGGGAGAVSGGLLLALLCVAFAEGGDDTGLACGGVGALIGGAIGAGIGAVVGLAVPRWSTIYEKEDGPLALRLREPEDDALQGWFSGDGPVGEVGLQLGYARNLGSSGATNGWGGRLHLLALLGPYLAVGPEVAWYSNVGSETFVPAEGPVFQSEHSLFQLGGLIRGGVEIGPTRTSALLWLGLTDNQTGHVGAAAGGEVELNLLAQVPVVVDVRYHFQVARDEFESVQRFLTFGLGSRARW
ncbi:hypothetical protein [Hyalangium gracile]|uniref:hypothetical protein n=1 Tax=Hyalangium gracile TaxID=394092 RepID=UPI001CCAE28E|nr:hypothetical protein [Hyalangium gracile]